MTHLLAAEGGYQGFVLTGTEKTWLVLALVAAVFGITVGLLLMRGVLRADQGSQSMRDIARAVQEGAQAFLRRQFRAIVMVVIPLAVLIFFTATVWFVRTVRSPFHLPRQVGSESCASCSAPVCRASPGSSV